MPIFCRHFCHKTDQISSLNLCDPKIISCVFFYILIEKYSSEEECNKSRFLNVIHESIYTMRWILLKLLLLFEFNVKDTLYLTTQIT
jgi:hypothetical protein